MELQRSSKTLRMTCTRSGNCKTSLTRTQMVLFKVLKCGTRPSNSVSCLTTPRSFSMKGSSPNRLGRSSRASPGMPPTALLLLQVASSTVALALRTLQGLVTTTRSSSATRDRTIPTPNPVQSRPDQLALRRRGRPRRPRLLTRTPLSLHWTVMLIQTTLRFRGRKRSLKRRLTRS